MEIVLIGQYFTICNYVYIEYGHDNIQFGKG